MSHVTRVTCPCHAVEIVLASPPLAQFHCHCDDCRRVHGGAYVAVSAYPRDALTVVRGATTSFALAVNRRASCAACGTRLFAERPDVPVRGLNAYLLPPGAFTPQFHMFCDFAVAQVGGDLPAYRTLPEIFGGDGATATARP